MTDLLPQAKLDTDAIAEIRKATDEIEAARRGQIEALKRDSPKARVVEYDHIDHYVFIQRREEVLKEMKRFLR
jgi:hypothetical protein